MAKKIKELNGIKIYYRGNAGYWFSLLFGLIAIAAVVLSFIMLPYCSDGSFTFKFMGQFTAYDLNISMINSITKKEIISGTQGTFEAMKVILSSSLGTGVQDGLLTAIMVAVTVFIDFAGIVAIVMLVMWFVTLFSGRVNPRKGMLVCVVLNFWFYLVYLAVAIIVIISQATKGTAIMDLLKTYMYPLVCWGALLVGWISLGVISHVYGNRMFFKDVEEVEAYKARMERKNAVGQVATLAGTVYNPQAQQPVAVQPSEVKVIINTNCSDKTVVRQPTKDTVEITQIHEDKPVGTLSDQSQVAAQAVATGEENKEENRKVIGLPEGVDHIGGHEYAKNTELQIAEIPEGIEEIGPSAFSNCVNLKVVTLPHSMKKIGPNSFFNCRRLKHIQFNGTKAEWKQIKRGSNWLLHSGITIVTCQDGPIAVDPEK